MFGKDWTSEYYDVMEFYYWEPQHLGKIKNQNSRYNSAGKALSHIQNMEVSLNHMFNVFFRLAPSSFINQVIVEFFSKDTEEKFSLQGRYAVSEFSSLVQPDLLFSSDETNFSIEMKIGAKSSLEQVYKYGLLHWMEQKHTNSTKKSFLLYMNKNNFSDLWTERFSSVGELKKQTLILDIETLKAKAAKNENTHIEWDEVKHLVGETDIGFCTYSDFAALLKRFTAQFAGNNEASETIEKLFGGLYSELERRQLI